MRDYVPTESVIFAKYFLRDLRDREAFHSNHLTPGCKTWRDAVPGLAANFSKISPIKQAAVVRNVTAYLSSDNAGDRFSHIILDANGGKRSSLLALATMTPGLHPFEGNSEEGVNILLHVLRNYRNGDFYMLSDIDLAFISKHAIARMHERGCDLTNNKVTSVLAAIGILGLITRSSKKHVRGEISLLYGDLLITGSLKHAAKPVGDGTFVNGTVLDVRTVLEAHGAHSGKLAQGEIAGHVVAEWLKTRPSDECDALADLIPFRPRREDDHTMKLSQAKKEQRV